MKKIKQMGDAWEREIAKRLGGKRQPSSGAFGTINKIASLTGDVVISYPWWKKALHLECKFGYGGNKSLSFKREWIEKVRTEADNARRYPAVALKFKGVTGGDIESAKVICFDLETWEKMMKEIDYLYQEYLSLVKEQFERVDA